MLRLIFKTGTEKEKLEKCRIIDNMRSEIEKKVTEGVEFSNESFLALAAFPKSQIETFFFARNGEIEAYIKVQDAANTDFKNAGYGIPTFVDLSDDVKKDWICYCISTIELQKIGWSDPNVVPAFVTEVFTKLGCTPDEITL